MDQLTLFNNESQLDNGLAVGEELIDARFVFSLFRSDENGYSVYKYAPMSECEHKNLICVGYYLPSLKNTTYTLRGRWENTKRGPQFAVTEFKEVIKADKEGIVSYLCSGVIKGIGKKTAEAIYAKFGNNALEILDADIEKLSEVKGIGGKTLKKIKTSYLESRVMRDLIMFGQKFGLTSEVCSKMYKEYKNEALELLKTNPYELTKRVARFNFHAADKIARAQGLPLVSDARFEACMNYVFMEKEATGNFGILIGEFGNLMLQYLNSSEAGPEYINEKTIELIKSGILSIRKIYLHGEVVRCLFRTKVVEIEKQTADDIYRIYTAEKSFKYDVKKLEEYLSHTKLDDVQKSAVKEALEHNISVITGGPGTGKTTIIEAIIGFYEKNAKVSNVILLAPTGKAARRMEEVTMHPSSTIHSRLRLVGYEETDEDIDINDSLIIIDEFSMVDGYLAYKLFSHILERNKVVIVGDPAQLPSVGPGAVLRDVIESGIVPVTTLKTVYRQNADDCLYTNISKIKDGITDLEQSKDFRMHETSSMEEAERIMVEEYIKAVEKYGRDNVYCIAPYKKFNAGVYRLNELLQERLNPRAEGKAELQVGQFTFRVSDPVMQIKNNMDASNGDIGQIESIDVEEKEITAIINGNRITYERSEIADYLFPGYAMTVHKSQGSEADCVITCLTSFHLKMLTRNIPYTAFSRAKKEVVVIGEKEALNTAIRTESINKRLTGLGVYLKEKEQFVPV